MKTTNHFGETWSRTKRELNDLLWDNLEESVWWPSEFEGDEYKIGLQKIRLQHERYGFVFDSFKLAFSREILRIENEDALAILRFGALRRVFSISNAINTVAEISYPDRLEICSD